MNIYFIILHYQNINDTINCINSIKKIKKKNNQINMIVLDNASPNNSGQKLKEEYQSDENVYVEIMKKNYGFSYTNNYGYSIAKDNKADIIMIINNDILIEDQDFIIKLEKIIEHNRYEIICPDILNLENNHQNPLRVNTISKKNAYINIIRNYLRVFLLSIPGIRILVSKILSYKKIKWMNNYYKTNNDIGFQNKDFSTFVPFGAFIIYTKKWIDKENIAFPSETFMYVEEDILAEYMIKNKYRIKYYNNLKVRHLEGASTEYINNSKINKQIFVYRNTIKSLKWYIKFINKVT